MRQDCQPNVWTEAMNSTCVSTNTTLPSPSPHPASISFEGHVRVLTPSAGFEAAMKAAMELESSLTSAWRSSADANANQGEETMKGVEGSPKEESLVDVNMETVEQNVKQEYKEGSEQVAFDKSPTEFIQDESSLSETGEYCESQSPTDHNGYGDAKVNDADAANRESCDNEDDNPLKRLEYALEQNGMLGNVYSHCEEGDFTIETTDKQGMKSYRCPLCSYTTPNRHTFECHLNGHYEHKCTICNFVGKNDDHLRDHLKDDHNMCVEEQDENGIRIPRVNSQGKVKTFKCKQCEFIALTKLDFWEHSRSHIKAEKLLTCPKCPFVTEYKHHLEYHLRNHFGSKPFKCNKCSYSCVNKSMLNSHMKSHSNIYQYRCADCTYATKYCHSLKLHLRKYKHKPAMVLNADGSPNPFPIIDVYGTRRGPKLKKDDCGFPKFTPHAMPFHNASYGVPTIHHPSPHMPTNIPLPYGVPFFNSYNQNNQLMMNKDKITLPEDEDSVGNEIKVSIPQENDRRISPDNVPLPSQYDAFLQQKPIKCTICDFCTLSRDHFAHHMVSHATCNNVNAQNSLKHKNELEGNRGQERQQNQQECFNVSQTLQNYHQNNSNSQSQKEIMINRMQGNLMMPDASPLGGIPIPASEEIKEYLARVFSTPLLFGSQGFSGVPQAKDKVPQPDRYTNSGTPPQNPEGNFPNSPRTESGLPPKVEEKNGIPLDLTKEGPALQIMASQDSPGMKNRRKGKAFKLERIAMKLQERQPQDQNNHANAFDTSEEAEIETPHLSTVSKPLAVKSKESRDESTSPTESNQEEVPEPWCDAYQCKFCDIAFRDIVLYTMHMGYHALEDPFKCNSCGKVTSDKVSFFVHIARSSHS